MLLATVMASLRLKARVPLLVIAPVPSEPVVPALPTWIVPPSMVVGPV